MGTQQIPGDCDDKHLEKLGMGTFLPDSPLLCFVVLGLSCIVTLGEKEGTGMQLFTKQQQQPLLKPCNKIKKPKKSKKSHTSNTGARSGTCVSRYLSKFNFEIPASVTHISLGYML